MIFDRSKHRLKLRLPSKLKHLFRPKKNWLAQVPCLHRKLSGLSWILLLDLKRLSRRLRAH
ncbi:putative prophage protein, partial [Streptococcus pneumoniae]